MAKKTTKDKTQEVVANCNQFEKVVVSCDRFEELITIVISLLTFQELRI